MFCSKCGSKLNSEESFCSSCGERVLVADHSDNPQELEKTKETTESKRSLWKTVGIWVIGIWAVITLIDAVLNLFMLITVGADITFIQISVWALALAVVLKLKLFKFKQR